MKKLLAALCLAAAPLVATQPVVRQYTVATLPAASSNNGVLAVVTDGANSADCATGGGAYFSVCVSNGTTWNSKNTPGIRSVSANDTATTADGTIFANASGGAFTETLPASPYSGETMYVKKTDSSSNAVTIDGNGKTIDVGSSTTLIVGTPGASVQLQYDGSAWWIL